MIWSSTWFVIKEGLDDLPPLTAAAVRFSIAALIMCALVPLLAAREGGGRAPAWLWIVIGFSNFSISFGIVYVCEQELPSGLVSVLWSVFPLLVAAGGHLFLPNEKLSVRQWAGFVLGFGGVVVLFLTELRDLGPAAVPMGALLLVSPLSASVGNLLLKRYATGMSSVRLNRNGVLVGAVVLTAAAWLLERDEPVRWSQKAIASVVYLSVVGTCVTFTIYFWLLRYARANRMALIAFVTPPLALLLGWVAAEEVISASTIIGSAIVVGGIALVVVK